MIRGIFDKLVTPPAQPNGQRLFGGAIAISLVLHGVLGVALIYGVNWQLPEPEVTPIMVDLVPPPEPKEPEPELPEQATSETPPPEPSPQPKDQPQSEEKVARLPPSSPVMKPVIEFGEKDSGPRINPDGRSKQEADEPEKHKPGATKAEEKQGADAEPSEVLRDEAAKTSKELELDLPEISEPEQVAIAEAAPDDVGTSGPVATPVTPAPKPARNPATVAREGTGEPGAMPSVKQLFSEAMLGDQSVRTAMANMPRSERASLLCMTEMRGQLMAARPQRPPEILPSFRLPTGTVLEQRKAAFRTEGKWHDLAFRCEVDEPVTKVLNFSYRVGDAIPREEWSQRGFPFF